MVNESGPKPIVEPVNQFRQSARGLWEREKGSGLQSLRQDAQQQILPFASILTFLPPCPERSTCTPAVFGAAVINELFVLRRARTLFSFFFNNHSRKNGRLTRTLQRKMGRGKGVRQPFVKYVSVEAELLSK